MAGLGAMIVRVVTMAMTMRMVVIMVMVVTVGFGRLVLGVHGAISWWKRLERYASGASQ